MFRKKSQKLKEKTKQIVKFCPKCKSTNVKSEMAVSIIYGAPQKWRCDDCGFSGFLFPEKEIEEGEENDFKPQQLDEKV